MAGADAATAVGRRPRRTPCVVRPLPDLLALVAKVGRDGLRVRPRDVGAVRPFRPAAEALRPPTTLAVPVVAPRRPEMAAPGPVTAGTTAGLALRHCPLCETTET